jgi:hypothetical protein
MADVHGRLAAKDLAALLGTAYANGEVEGLRQLLGIAVQSAVIVEQVRGRKDGPQGWLRAAVQWTPAVCVLLEHGYLLQGPPAPTPQVPAPLGASTRVKRWRARRREQQAALTKDLLSVPQAAAELNLGIEGLRSALKRGSLTGVHVEGRPQRTFIERQEVERYRREILGRPGRKRQAGGPS